MKAFLCAQLNPSKTLKQLLTDRYVYRLLLLSAVIISLCR